ncbi:MAG: hypothetical protein K0S57_85 [Ramlibacter sp.]|jgi:hypothetical protein|nr:hypothetical protein [Ramlibacter sp.]
MSHSVDEAKSFLRASEFSLVRFFDVIGVRSEALKSIDAEIQRYRKLQAADAERFMDEGQWEAPDPNWEYAQHIRRTQHFKKAEENAPAMLPDLLAKRGATEIAIGIAAGAVLQVGKQVLSYRFGELGNLPSGNSRKVGTLPVTTLIWEGRNHALHWEEGKPKARVAAMLQALRDDGRVPPGEGRNYAPEILDALGWGDAAHVLCDLEAMIHLH